MMRLSLVAVGPGCAWRLMRLVPPAGLRSGSIPLRGDSAYEVKWDGLRGLLRTENGGA
jgi:hypothetical protein